jgi:hypothetical protein
VINELKKSEEAYEKDKEKLEAERNKFEADLQALYKKEEERKAREKAEAEAKAEAERKRREAEQAQQREEELIKTIGHLTVQVNWLKKKSDELLGDGWEKKYGYHE